MSEHTPTPWKWHWRFEDGIATESVLAEPRPGHAYAIAICPRYQTEERWRADATMICRAVSHHDELVAALRPFAVLATLHGDDHEQIAHNVGVTLGDCRNARAVLAKVENGS